MGAHALDRSSAMPLWSQLQEDLRSRIRRGEFDAVFPGELVLASEYSVSRATVRQALAQLRADGVVTAGRGRPPQVAGTDTAPPIEQPLGRSTPSSTPSRAPAGSRPASCARWNAPRTASSPPASASRSPRHCSISNGCATPTTSPWPGTGSGSPSAAAPLVGVDLTHTALYDELAGRTDLRVDSGRSASGPTAPTPPRPACSTSPSATRCFGWTARAAATTSPWSGDSPWPVPDRFTLHATFGPGDGYRLGHSAAGGVSRGSTPA